MRGLEGDATLDQALDSLSEASKVCGTLPAGSSRPAFAIVAFHSGAKRTTVTKKIGEYLTKHKLDGSSYWPDAVVVFSGAKAHPKGFGVFRSPLHAGSGDAPTVTSLTDPLWTVDGGDEALAALVTLLSKRRIDRAAASSGFDFGSYIFRPVAAAAAGASKTVKKPSNKSASKTTKASAKKGAGGNV